MFACIHLRRAQPSLPGFPDSIRDALRDCAYHFSPRVEELSPETVIADLEGCGRLFGTDEQIAGRMAERAAALGLDARVAIAANADAAICAARALPGPTVIPVGQERERLGPLPIAVLLPPPEIADILAAWGIRRLDQLAALPEDGLSERLGVEGVRLRRQACGAAARALIATAPAPGFEHAVELDYPVALLEPLSFILASLLNALFRNLAAHALATNEITVRLKLEDESEHERVLRLPVPTRDSGAVLRLVQLDLEAHPPRAAVVGLWLRTRPAKPRSLQDGLFVPQAPEPQRLELTLARLSRLVGPSNCGSPELLNTHRPDAFVMRQFVVFTEKRGKAEEVARGEGRGARGKEGARGEGRGAGKAKEARSAADFCLVPRTSNLEPRTFLAFRHFRPALAADVQLVHERPARVSARGVRGKVLSLAGPWTTAGDWWRDSEWARDEWDVALNDGALYRIYFDRKQRAWFVDGSYD